MDETANGLVQAAVAVTNDMHADCLLKHNCKV